MFTRPTVFVIGAGASAELGLPAGSHLKEQIARSLTFRFDWNKQVSGDPVLYSALKQQYGEQHGAYSQAGHDFAKVVGTFVSIDEALHYYSGRSEVVLLGKLAIARNILSAERGSVLYSKTTPAKVDLGLAGDSWLPHLLSMATSSLTMQQMEQAFQHVTIVNFNYDRSIEYYLYVALQEKLNLGADLAQAAVDGLRIIRPYGSVGLPSWCANGMAYGGHEYEDQIDLFKAADGIRTYTEQNIESETANAIHDYMEEAELIMILGFGFHEQNINLLSARSSKQRRIFATVSGIAEPNHDVLSERLSACIQTHITPALLAMKANELLYKLRPSIMAAAN